MQKEILANAIANMNPALMIINVYDNMVYIHAGAQEGLIKQHTAEKAVKNYINLLQQV